MYISVYISNYVRMYCMRLLSGIFGVCVHMLLLLLLLLSVCMCMHVCIQMCTFVMCTRVHVQMPLSASWWRSHGQTKLPVVNCHPIECTHSSTTTGWREWISSAECCSSVYSVDGGTDSVCLAGTPSCYGNRGVGMLCLCGKSCVH